MLLRLLLVGHLLLLAGTPSYASDSPSWLLLKYEYEGYPVVMKVMEELPPEPVRERYGMLIVISWNYDRTENNGMPLPAVNNQMIALEDATDSLEDDGLSLQVYTKTGNGLKELVYYAGSTDEFMKAFNEALADHPRYPLEIEFFDDPEWSDLQTVHEVYLERE